MKLGQLIFYFYYYSVFLFVRLSFLFHSSKRSCTCVSIAALFHICVYISISCGKSLEPKS